jgi:hypothetical protein
MLRYILWGAVVGLGYGSCALVQTPSATQADFAYAIGFGPLIGAFMGLELFHTRAWRRFGRKGWFARWAVAGASGFGAAGSVLVLMGELPRWGAWAASALGAVLGICISLEWIGGPDDERSV